MLHATIKFGSNGLQTRSDVVTKAISRSVSTIHQSLATQLPSTKFNSRAVSEIVNSAFPGSTRISVGRIKAVHVVGIEEVISEEPSTGELKAKLVELEVCVQHLEERIRQLEQEHHTYSPQSKGTDESF